MHSVVTSAIGSIATDIFARESGRRVGISSSIFRWWSEICSVGWGGLSELCGEVINLFYSPRSFGQEMRTGVVQGK